MILRDMLGEQVVGMIKTVEGGAKLFGGNAQLEQLESMLDNEVDDNILNTVKQLAEQFHIPLPPLVLEAIERGKAAEQTTASDEQATEETPEPVLATS